MNIELNPKPQLNKHAVSFQLRVFKTKFYER